MFAGEHTCKEHPDTVGGAMMTGWRAARHALHLMTGEAGAPFDEVFKLLTLEELADGGDDSGDSGSDSDSDGNDEEDDDEEEDRDGGVGGVKKGKRGRKESGKSKASNPKPDTTLNPKP